MPVANELNSSDKIDSLAVSIINLSTKCLNKNCAFISTEAAFKDNTVFARFEFKKHFWTHLLQAFLNFLGVLN